VWAALVITNEPGQSKCGAGPPDVLQSHPSPGHVVPCSFSRELGFCFWVCFTPACQGGSDAHLPAAGKYGADTEYEIKCYFIKQNVSNAQQMRSGRLGSKPPWEGLRARGILPLLAAELRGNELCLLPARPVFARRPRPLRSGIAGSKLVPE